MPKIIGDSLADHREQVRRRLFDAMMRLIGERGYDSITLADIAAGAGVGRTAVYNHFPDKESVLLAMAQDATSTYLHRLNAELAEASSWAERIRIFLRLQMTELAGHHARMAGIGTALSVDGRNAMREHVAPIMQTLRNILNDAVAAGEIPTQDINLESLMISAITAARFTVGMAPPELEHAIAVATQFILRGLGFSEDG